MGFFKNEVVVLKESTASRDYLARLEALYENAPPEMKPELEKEIKITQAGIFGEDNIMYELRNSGMDLVVLHDVYIEAGDLSAQIDFFVITPKINFLIECKNLYGDIEINSKGDFIRSFKVNGKTINEGIYSPVTQNERHLQVLRDKRVQGSGIVAQFATKMWFYDFHKSLVVLANPKTILKDKYAPKDIKQKVYRVDQMVRVMKEMNAASKEWKSSFSDMVEIGNRMLNKCSDYEGFSARYDELEQKVKEAQERLEKAKPKVEAVPVNRVKLTPAVPPLSPIPTPPPSPEVLFCPRCGKPLVLRTAKRGNYAGNQFYGCTGYPNCRYMKNL